MKWVGYDEEEWERENLLVRDGCTDSIRHFWATSQLDPTQDFYKDPTGQHRCTVCCKSYKRDQDLKAHKTREGHHESTKPMTTKTAVKDAIQNKRREMQNDYPKVVWRRMTVAGEQIRTADNK